jgi:hypothetical protein
MMSLQLQILSTSTRLSEQRLLREPVVGMARLSGTSPSKSVRHSLLDASRAQHAARETQLDNELAGSRNECSLDVLIFTSKIPPLLLGEYLDT